MAGSLVKPGLIAAVPGALLAAVFGAVAILRHGKPLHPEGRVGAGHLTLDPGGRSGCPLLDEPGDLDCLVRASYAMGTGPEAPDIEGFALRLLPEGQLEAPADVLFASTGSGRVGRFILRLRRPRHHGVQTTLLPVQASGRPLLLRLLPRSGGAGWPADYDLAWAHGTGAWQRCGRLSVDWVGGTDEPLRFDPIANQLPGTEEYRWVRWLREPAYLSARLLSPQAGTLRAGRSRAGAGS
ncbi:phosphodiesterase [Intrasporangium chromatireducens]|uniref:phosphodiesterase n=1 Tax=Intrasporangium chromatireducens TaxID=1386088 RepID=UPI0012DCB0B4|nr:phosphodiesterase [Intrasporangium chromatireducens]